MINARKDFRTSELTLKRGLDTADTADTFCFCLLQKVVPFDNTHSLYTLITTSDEIPFRSDVLVFRGNLYIRPIYFLEIDKSMGLSRTRTLSYQKAIDTATLFPRFPRSGARQPLILKEYSEMKDKHTTKLALGAILFTILGVTALSATSSVQDGLGCNSPLPRTEKHQLLSSLVSLGQATGCLLVGTGLGLAIALDLTTRPTKVSVSPDQQLILCRDAFLKADNHASKDYSLWLLLNKPTASVSLTSALRLEALNKLATHNLLSEEQAIASVEWALVLDNSELIVDKAVWKKLNQAKEDVARKSESALKQVALMKRLGWQNSLIYRAAAIHSLWKENLISESERQSGVLWIKSL